MQCLNPLLCVNHNNMINSVVKKKNRQIEILGRLRTILANRKLNSFNDLLKENANYILIPCRKCINCRKNRSREFAIRSKIEFEKSNKDLFNYFITLTYDDDVDEITKEYHLKKVNGVPTLCSRDLTLFIKRLRASQWLFTETKMSYLACGEYGTRTCRPHYHLIVHNCIIPDLKEYSIRNGNIYYTSEYISKMWLFGNVLICIANINTAQYVAKYMLKSSPEQKLHFENLGLEKPFLHCSKNYGFDIFELKRQTKDDKQIFYDLGDSKFYSKPLEYYQKKCKYDSNIINKKLVDKQYKSIYNYDITTLKTLENLEVVNNKKVTSRDLS